MEDEPLVRNVVTNSLEDLSFQVAALDCGDAAWKLIEAGLLFDLLITDIRMPGEVDGIELARRAKARLPRSNIIIMSGDTGGRDPAKYGFRNFLQKPFTAGQLAALIGSIDMNDATFRQRERGRSVTAS